MEASAIGPVLPRPALAFALMEMAFIAPAMFQSLAKSLTGLFSVGNPDIFDLCGLAQKFLAFTLLSQQPGTRIPIAYPGAFHIASRGQFHHLTPLTRAKVPHGIYIVVFGQNFAQSVALTSNNIDDSGGYVGGFEHLIAVRRAQG